MANVVIGRKILAIAILGCLCAALVASPAYAFYYVHGEDNVAQGRGKGVIEVCCTVDATARGEGVRTELLIIPAGSTVAACLNEGIESGNSQNGLDAIHDYRYTDLKDYLSDKEWTCTVHEAASQNPGTHTTYDTSGTEGSDTPLERFDSVVFTVE